MKNKKFTAIVCLLMTMLVALFLAACGNDSGGEAPKDDNYDFSQTGGTLTQEKSVDEGDIVKTFGNVAYKLQSDGIVVYNLSNGNINKIAFRKFSSNRNVPLEMYVTDKTITILYGRQSTIEGSNYSTNVVASQMNEQDYSKIYLEVLSNPTNTENASLSPVDLSEKIEYSFEFNGKFLASRMYTDSKNAYFAFSYDGMFSYNQNSTTNSDIVGITGNGASISYKENNENKTLSNPQTVPGIKELRSGFKPTVFMKLNLSDVQNGATLNGVYGATLKDIYMSETSIIPVFTSYTTENSGGGCYSYYDYIDLTHCFKLSSDTLKIVDGVTLVGYTIYDRRAIKDYGDVIYITATKDDGSGTTVISLDTERFSLLNRLDNIAPNENVKSVTYGEENDKRYCYITTFLKIDPLFKIDITDPYRMQTLGFMEMPGFSTFMLNVGDYLLTIGYKENGSQGIASDLKISLYDSKGDGLTSIDDRIIENVVYAEAINDPRVIAVSNTTFAFSATTVCGAGAERSYAQALYVFDIDTQKEEIVYLGKVSNFGKGANFTYDYCTDRIEVDEEPRILTKFGQYAFCIQRARFNDGYLYTFSDGAIASYKIVEADALQGTEKYVSETYTARTFTHLSENDLFYQ